MNKKYLYLFFTFLVIIAFYFKQSLIENTLYIFNQTKQTISTYISNINTNITNHFNQIEKIEKLSKENKKLQTQIQQLLPIKENCEKLKIFKQLNIPHIFFTQTISYAKLPDMSTIYIDYNKKITSPKGLIYNNQAAGIVIKNIKNFSLAYLNNNPNTSYTVFIGKNKIPGVIFGGKQMIIKYIPKYSQIKIGDKVITSGLDKIFYEGINVGIITKIIKKNLYQEAIIQPFYNPLHPSFFYVVGN